MLTYHSAMMMKRMWSQEQYKLYKQKSMQLLYRQACSPSPGAGEASSSSPGAGEASSSSPGEACSPSLGALLYPAVVVALQEILGSEPKKREPPATEKGEEVRRSPPPATVALPQYAALLPLLECPSSATAINLPVHITQGGLFVTAWGSFDAEASFAVASGGVGRTTICLSAAGTATGSMSTATALPLSALPLPTLPMAAWPLPELPRLEEPVLELSEFPLTALPLPTLPIAAFPLLEWATPLSACPLTALPPAAFPLPVVLREKELVRLSAFPLTALPMEEVLAPLSALPLTTLQLSALQLPALLLAAIAIHAGFDDAVTLYNVTLTHIIDTVVLLTTRTVKKDRNSPWYTLQLRLLKSAFCKLEHKWRSSGLTVHREISTDHLASYRHALAAARVKYLSEIITIGHCDRVAVW
ncbi:UNVERIFIED_CONTAM: hypothetical protein FKN15_055209 [Acipenser sinensis]